MGDLRLAVKREYFEQMASGEKTEEYRLANKYWTKRLVDRKHPYRNLVITLGYPLNDQIDRILIFPYVGWERKTITHKHFGPDPVEVFAITVTRNPIF